MFRFLPEQASTIAPRVDWINNLITDISLFFTVAIVGSMIYFAVRYRRRDGVVADTPQIKGNDFLEMVWTIVPTIISIYVAYYGVTIYADMRRIPDDALKVDVRAHQWAWNFAYQNGKDIKQTTNELVVPVNKTTELVMQSEDVLHSFFIPSMRVKKDVLPGRYTNLAFTPVKTGEYPVFCTEYCGKDHSAMLATLRVVSQADYDRWLVDRSDELKAANMNPVELGQKLYTDKGCNACHSLNGTQIVGPTFQKLFNREEKLTDGTKIKADENYIQRSIYEPLAQVVEGYAPVMPSFKGQLDDKQIAAIISFIKAQDGSAPTQAASAPAAAAEPEKPLSAMTPAERGKKIYTDKVCLTCHSLDGSKVVGPTFKGLYGRKEDLEGGASVVVDDAYIKESILDPSAKVVKGYPPAMPPYQGQLNDDQIKDVIEFLKTVK